MTRPGSLIAISIMALATAAFSIGEVVETTEPGLEEIVAKHLEARGGEERLRAVRTLIYRNGTYREEGFTGSGAAFMAFARPFLRVVGNPEDPRTSIMEGYDGSAWEWYRDPGITIRTVGAAAGATRRGADFDGPFLDAEEKGYELELLGKTIVGGQQVWDILVTYPDGFMKHFFLDAESFLRIGDRYEAPFHAFGESVRTESRFSDHRWVDGVLFPFRITEVDVATDTILSAMEWGAIEVNRGLPRAWFSPPVNQRTPVQELLDLLYLERSDVQAVLATYRQFRRAYPDLDTRRGVEFIGYQMLKMGDHESAVALLRENAIAHPDSADAAFSFGRALITAGEREAGEAELRRALRIDPDHTRAAAAMKKGR